MDADPRTPEVPNLTKAAEQAAQEAPPEVRQPAPDEPKPAAVAPASATDERYWTEDRIIRIGLWVLFVVFAVGVVISLSRWDLMAKVPPLPWVVGLALVAGPAWKAYTDYAEEAKGRRMRTEQAKTAFGVRVVPPRDRNAG